MHKIIIKKIVILNLNINNRNKLILLKKRNKNNIFDFKQ